MGKAVTHFEIVGKDGAELRSFYSAIFGWQIDAANPMNYGIVSREGNTNADGAGIGGAVSDRAPMATRATSPSTSRWMTSRPPSRRRQASAEAASWDRTRCPGWASCSASSRILRVT